MRYSLGRMLPASRQADMAFQGDWNRDHLPAIQTRRLGLSAVYVVLGDETHPAFRLSWWPRIGFGNKSIVDKEE